MATIIVHYPTNEDESIQIRGAAHPLSWHHDTELSKVEGKDHCWTISGISGDFRLRYNDKQSKGACYHASTPGSVLEIYPWFEGHKGELVTFHIGSKILGNKRKIAVHLPPSYDENTLKSYPVMIMQDGHNLFFKEDSFCGVTWRLDEALNGLYEKSRVRETIVIGVYPIKREFEYLPPDFVVKSWGGGAEKYLDFLEKELLPEASERFRIKSGPVGIGGSSFGGIISLHAWLTRPHQYNICGSFSPSANWADHALVWEVGKTLAKREGGSKLYVDAGTIRDELTWTMNMVDLIKDRKCLTDDQFKYKWAEGHSHSESFWAERAPKALEWLLAEEHNTAAAAGQGCR